MCHFLAHSIRRSITRNSAVGALRVDADHTTALPVGNRRGVPDGIETARIWRSERGTRLTFAGAQYLPKSARRNDLERAKCGKAQQCGITSDK